MSDDKYQQSAEAKAARDRLQSATEAMAREKRFDDLPPEMTEIEIMEAATRLVKEARRK